MSRPLRVLVVEDSQSDAELVVRALRRAGFEPEWRRVEDGPEMAAALAEQTWDVIIADYRLPQFDAPRALAMLREADLDVPFIVVSGSIGEEPAVAMMKAGAHDYVMKDRAERLAPAVERELREAQNRRERRQALEALRDREELLRSVLDTATDAVISVDDSGKIILWNKAAETMFGYTTAEALGKHVTSLMLPEGREAYEADMRRIAAGEPSALVGKATRLVGLRRDGYDFPMEVSLGVCDSRAGRVYTAIVRDVTDRERAEQERRDLEVQIGHMQRLESVGRLAGGVAHDFNNLLVVIFGACEAMLAEMEPQDPLRERVTDVLSAGHRARELTKQLLAFSRRQVLRPRLIDLNEVVSGVLKMLRRLIGEDIEVTSVLAPDLAPVIADAAQLEQVLVNLAVNARDAMPSGGQLTFETANVVLDANHAATHPSITPGPHVMLSVSDTGHGMDRETQKHIFEPFYTTKEEGKGTGLGLAMVYGIVKQHEGSIWVYSEPDHGTTFKIYLPAAEGHSEDAPESEMGHPTKGGETILLVEDDDAVREVVSEMLAAHGYHVIQAESPHRAIELAAQEDFALLVTDMVMPGMNGRELYSRVLEVRPGVKALFMSGYTHDSTVLRDVARERFALLEKPFTTSDLASKVREALDG